jgi:hypothetical protein
MRIALLLAFSLFSAQLTLAATLEPAPTPIEDIRKSVFEGLGACDQAIFTNDEYFAVSLKPLRPGVGHLRVYSLKDSTQVIDLATQSQILDVKIEGDTAYLLSGTTFEAWSLSSQKQLFIYPSHSQAGAGLNWRQRAQGFVLNGGRAIIAHGTLGASVLDLKTGEVVKVLSMPTISSAQDIALVDANRAVLAIDNDAEATFRGMYILNLKTLEFSKQIKVDNAFPQAIRVLNGDRLMLIYSNAVWKFGMTQALASSKEPKPSRRAWQFPGLEFVNMEGKVAFDKKNLYACFKSWDDQTHQLVYKPMAFDLAALQLQ